MHSWPHSVSLHLGGPSQQPGTSTPQRLVVLGSSGRHTRENGGGLVEKVVIAADGRIEPGAEEEAH
jgi:hypothetical protein